MEKNFNTLSGSEKAAIILLSLEEDKVTKIFALLDEDEIREISQAMASLGAVGSDTVEAVYTTFTAEITSIGSVQGSFENTERLLARTLDKEHVDLIMEEIRGPAGRTMWDKLANVNESVLANYLKNEYPQTVAVILSKIKADHAARVLTMLPDQYAMEVIARMLRMETVQKEVLEDIEKTLRTEFMSNLARTSRRDPHEAMAEIFNSFDRSTESKFLEGLEEKNKDSAEKIKSLMFTFEDLVKIDSAGIQTILREVDKDKLGIALKGASENIKDLFFKNMSERAGKIMKEDMEGMGPVRVKDVDEAQTIIIAATKDLADKGEITINESKDDEELIY